jgi:cytochrome b pre-mRNA-processing protein 3
MSFFSRLFSREPDPREALRPLWHRIVLISREPAWYTEGGVADEVAGRFDMIATALSLVLLRMEKDPELADQTALLTELFVEDMDRQLRESGIGDVVVGKHVGKLMSVLGGRLGAYREALENTGETTLLEAIDRNVTLADENAKQRLAELIRGLHAALRDTPGEDVLEGRIGR